jgi:hypothetical protein
MKDIQQHFNGHVANEKAQQYSGPGGTRVSEAKRHSNALAGTRAGRTGIEQSHVDHGPRPVPGIEIEPLNQGAGRDDSAISGE